MKKPLIALVSCVVLGIAVYALWPTDSPSSDGTSLRLFVTLTDTRPEAHTRTGSGGLPWNTLRSAVSTDGYNFTFDDQEWLTSDDMADPAVAVDSDGTWVVASGTGTSSLRAAATEGCPIFSDFPEVLKGGGIPDLLPVSGGFRMYYSGDGGILSAFSSDGETFTKDSGLRLATPSWLSLVADPTVAQRSDGTYVMYFKGTEGIAKSPYEHLLYRATSEDGLQWTAEEEMLIPHVSVPGAYTDESGTVWVYYLNFEEWPNERESVWATYELPDGSLAEPGLVTFTPTMETYLWANDPDPVLVPNGVDLEECE